MRIHTGFEITYDCPEPVPMLLMVSVHPSRRGDLETPDWVQTDPMVHVTQYLDGFGNICSRVLAPAGRFRVSSDFIVTDEGRVDDYAPDAEQIPVEQLPNEVIVYLLGSRYCETDRLSNLAWSLFGATRPGWTRVQAIVDYVHDRIRFGYDHALPTRTAAQGHEEQVGVCRDFAHLAVTLFRAMNIPARYCTGYLGDISVPPVDAPMDFSAWFEAYLEGGWYTFDARHNQPRVGRIVIARGRDAMDVAITHTFGAAYLTEFQVVTDEVDPSDAAALAASELIAAE